MTPDQRATLTARVLATIPAHLTMADIGFPRRTTLISLCRHLADLDHPASTRILSLARLLLDQASDTAPIDGGEALIPRLITAYRDQVSRVASESARSQARRANRFAGDWDDTTERQRLDAATDRAHTAYLAAAAQIEELAARDPRTARRHRAALEEAVSHMPILTQS
jgi:hypothetical protein